MATQSKTKVVALTAAISSGGRAIGLCRVSSNNDSTSSSERGIPMGWGSTFTDVDQNGKTGKTTQGTHAIIVKFVVVVDG